MTKISQSSRGRWMVVILSGFLAFAIGIIALYISSTEPNPGGQSLSLWDRIFPQDTGPRRPMPRSRHIKADGLALRMYANDYDTLPYSPDGTPAAFYGLKDYLDTGDAAPQPPAFDDARRLLTNCPFDYINAANLTLDNLPPMLVLLAEHQLDANGGRWCLPFDGHPRYVAAGETCVVGKELNE